MSQYLPVFNLGFVCAWNHSQKGNRNDSKGRQQTSLPKGCKEARFPQYHHFLCINPALKWQHYCCGLTWEEMEQRSGAEGGERMGGPEDACPPSAIMHPTASIPHLQDAHSKKTHLLLLSSVSKSWGSSFALWMSRGQIQIAGLRFFFSEIINNKGRNSRRGHKTLRPMKLDCLLQTFTFGWTVRDLPPYGGMSFKTWGREDRVASDGGHVLPRSCRSPRKLPAFKLCLQSVEKLLRTGGCHFSSGAFNLSSHGGCSVLLIALLPPPSAADSDKLILMMYWELGRDFITPTRDQT